MLTRGITMAGVMRLLRLAVINMPLILSANECSRDVVPNPLPPWTGLKKGLQWGDSNTCGVPAQNTGNAWRQQEFAFFVNDQSCGIIPGDLELFFQGPISTGTSPTILSYGVSGARTQTLIDNIAADCGSLDVDWTEGMIGSGDALDDDAAGFPARYDQLLQIIQGLWPAARHKLTTVPVLNTTPAIHAAFLAINASLPALWDAAEARGMIVIRADAASAVTYPASFGPDLFHLSIEGNREVAEEFRLPFRRMMGY